jgi:hypothetical protein
VKTNYPAARRLVAIAIAQGVRAAADVTGMGVVNNDVVGSPR